MAILGIWRKRISKEDQVFLDEMKRARKKSRKELYDEMREVGLDLTSPNEDDDDENEKGNSPGKAGRVQEEREMLKEWKALQVPGRAKEGTKEPKDRIEEGKRGEWQVAMGP